MNKIIISAAVAIISIGLASCGKSDQNPSIDKSAKAFTTVNEKPQLSQSTANEALFEWAETKAKHTLQRMPLEATSLGVSEEYVGAYFNDKLFDYSAANIAEEKRLNAETLTSLAAIDRSALSGIALSTYDTLFAAASMAAKLKPYVHGSFSQLSVFTPFIVTQLSGPHINIPRSLQTQHPLKSEADALAYLKRLEQLELTLKEIALAVEHEATVGIHPPTFAVEGAINFIQKFTAKPAAENPLVATYKERLTEAKNLPEEKAAAMVDSATALVEEKVYVGYKALLLSLQKVLPQASEHAGIWDLENGDIRYQLSLENFGANGKTAEQIHTIGLAEVARIQKEMDTILLSQGHTNGSVIERYNALTTDEQYLYPNTDEGRKALLDGLNIKMQEITDLLPGIITVLPKAAVEVRRIAEYEQDGSAGGYYTSPSLDGSRPGIYWINLKDTAAWAKFRLPSLTYHEASPGHHLQIAISQQIENMPMIRKMMWFGAYGEGWALYAEVLAKELGLYKNDPLGDLGRLQMELFRAARLVVDTGLHHKKWSREKAIEYLLKNTGGVKDSVTREVERYSVWPGQACSYKLGQLKILELREFARKELGDAFDIREFNDRVLGSGSVPLSVLDGNIKQWVKGKG